MKQTAWCSIHKCHTGDCFVIHYPAASFTFPQYAIGYALSALLGWSYDYRTGQ